MNTREGQLGADFIVLKEDPLADGRAAGAIESVWIAGNQVR